VGRTRRGADVLRITLGTAGARKSAGKRVTVIEGLTSAGAVRAGALAAETMQQAPPVQSMGAVAGGWDSSQVMPIGMEDIAEVLSEGQQSMALWVPQAL
jgi:hypothetical protein